MKINRNISDYDVGLLGNSALKSQAKKTTTKREKGGHVLLVCYNVFVLKIQTIWMIKPLN